MYMLGVQEYESICCGVVCYVYSNHSNYSIYKSSSSEYAVEYIQEYL